VGHLVLLGVLSFLLSLALQGRRIRLGRWSPGLGATMVGLGISLEEASQGFFPARTLSAVDLACSYLGIYLGARAAASVLARFGDRSAS
jgi:polysaccharide biosynthesis protein VpsQ